MKPTFFASPSELRAWFERHHGNEQELLVGFYRKASKRPSVTYQEALDEALCFGWIDGIRKSVDDVSYTIRFTPRKHLSNWSRINVKRAEELHAVGLMREAGLAAFRARDETRTGVYSYEEQYRQLDGPREKIFRRNRRAWEFFQAQPPGYQRLASWWVMSAKKEQTRARRLATLIEDSENGRRLA